MAVFHALKLERSEVNGRFCYENLPSEGRNNPSCPRTGCLHYRKHGFRRSQAGYQAPNPALSDVLDIHVFFCLD